MKIKHISQHLRNIAKSVPEDDNYRKRAYFRAAGVIDAELNPEDDVPEGFEWESLNWIGPSISHKIVEIIEEGVIPPNPAGFDPELPEKYVNYLAAHDIFNQDELVRVIRDNGRSHILLPGIVHFLGYSPRTYWEPVIREITHAKGLQENSLKIQVAGSYRRKKNYVHDLDFVVKGSYEDLRKFLDDLVDAGTLYYVSTNKGRKMYRARIYYRGANIKADFRIVDKEYNFHAALLYLTGPKEFNIECRSLAKKNGYSLSEYGLKNTETGEMESGLRSETAILRNIGKEFVSPEER